MQDPLAKVNADVADLFGNRGWDVIVRQLETLVQPSVSANEPSAILLRTNTLELLDLLLGVCTDSRVVVINSGLIMHHLTRSRIKWRLSAANVTMPRFFVANSPFALLRSLTETCYPIYVKPDALYGPIVHRVATSDQLRHLLARGELPFTGRCIAEEHIPDSANYIKLYCVGSVIRSFVLDSRYALSERPLRETPIDSPPVTERQRMLASTIASTLELEVFTMDLVESGADLQVIDVNPIPAFVHDPTMWSVLEEHVAEAVATRHALSISAPRFNSKVFGYERRVK